VQRRYPQIYKSNDRLLLKPETIDVKLRDFMISVKSGSSSRNHARANYGYNGLQNLYLPLLVPLHLWLLRYRRSSSPYFLRL
jgi:hypothetical protein